jgi:hypothetical protein
LVEIYANLTNTLCSFPSIRIINKLINPFLTKTDYHKNLYDFFPRYFSIHLRNILLVDDTPYKTYQNPPFNAIFIESYKEMPKEHNHFLRIIFLYLELFYYSWLHITTFVEDYPFGAIKNFKENDVKLETYLRNAPWEMSLSIEID